MLKAVKKGGLMYYFLVADSFDWEKCGAVPWPAVKARLAAEYCHFSASLVKVRA